MFSDYLQSDHMQREKEIDAADMKDWISMQWDSLPDAVRAAWKQKYRKEWTEFDKEELVASLGKRPEDRPKDNGWMDMIRGNVDTLKKKAGEEQGEGNVGRN